MNDLESKGFGGFAEEFLDMIQDAVLVLDTELRVISANPAFGRKFYGAAEYTVGQPVYDIGDGQWDIEPLRVVLERVLPREKRYDNLLVDHEFRSLGELELLINAREVVRDDGRPVILLTIHDITGILTDQYG